MELISPLVKTYGDFSVYVELYEPEKSYETSPIKQMLPLYEVEINITDQKEVCFMVKGLGEVEDNENQTPLNFSLFIKKISEIKETCKDHFIVLAQKDLAPPSEDEEYEEGDYIMLHLPAAEVKTSSDDDNKIFNIMILPFNEDYEHIHYGNINNPNSEGVIYKNDQNKC